ncbi:MAG: hypothetical protein KGH60_03020 [Candidatus Micrarchaeota archaeon]|nr:hypothetical protein [Candidatus Micrarchaeota archaeon]
MSKNITLSVNDDIYRIMKDHPEINWSTITRKALEAFTKVLSRAEGEENRIAKQYGADVINRINFGISENFNENKFPGDAGMVGAGFNAGLNFNFNIAPTLNRNQPGKNTTIKETLKNTIKE